MSDRRNPGQTHGRTVTAREILFSPKNLITVGGVLSLAAYDGAHTGYENIIRAGTPLGRITASKLWVPCKRTSNTTTGTVTSAVLTDARAFKAGDVVSIGSDTGLTISAVDYLTNTITIPSTAISAGEAVVAEDGSQICRGFLNEEIDLWDELTRTNISKPFTQLVAAGFLRADQILGDLAAIRAAAGMFISGILWDDQQGMT